MCSLGDAFHIPSVSEKNTRSKNHISDFSRYEESRGECFPRISFIMSEQPNGARYLLVGGARTLLGTGFRLGVEKSLKMPQTPTSRVHPFKMPGHHVF